MKLTFIWSEIWLIFFKFDVSKNTVGFHLEQQILNQETKDSGWWLDEFVSMTIYFLLFYRIEKFKLCENSIDIFDYLKLWKWWIILFPSVTFS